MKERPILFSGPMVKAILDGRKTQTRRVIKPQPSISGPYEGFLYGRTFGYTCPYGSKGEALWVRETWRYDRETDYKPIAYRADGQIASEKWKPSIFMPRWASRITLEITDVRVERVKDISPHNALAEGIRQISKDAGLTWKYGISDNDGYPGHDNHGWPWKDFRRSPVEAFKKLWDSINGKKYPWESNPWVWVIEFKRIKPTE